IFEAAVLQHLAAQADLAHDGQDRSKRVGLIGVGQFLRRNLHAVVQTEEEKAAESRKVRRHGDVRNVIHSRVYDLEWLTTGKMTALSTWNRPTHDRFPTDPACLAEHLHPLALTGGPCEHRRDI